MKTVALIAMFGILFCLLAPACHAQYLTYSTEIHFTANSPEASYPAPTTVHAQSVGDLTAFNLDSSGHDVSLRLTAYITAINSSSVQVVANSKVTYLIDTVPAMGHIDCYNILDDYTALGANTYTYTAEGDGHESIHGTTVYPQYDYAFTRVN